MGKCITVKEYDTITCNPNFDGHDGTYTYLEKECFDKLVEFVHEFTGSPENADAIDFLRCYVKKNVGTVVSIRNYVGLIQMKNGFQIQVLPKIDLSEDDSTQTKRIFIRMLKSLKDFPCKVFNDAGLHIDKMNLYELFISMYLQEVRRLLRHGLKSGYVSQEDNLRFFKGKLLVNENIKMNAAHQERFYMAYDEFHPNRAENKLVKSTLLKLSRLTTSAENAKEIRQMLTAFEMVDASTNYAKDFTQIVIDRTTRDYDALLQWSKVFLFDKSFTTFSGETTSRALLFPMESVYESFVAKQVKKAFVPEGWNVSTQDRRFYLFEEPRRQFALRPDIVLMRGNRTVIMDTKWKRLINNENKNYGIAQEDMYQMYAYSKKYGTAEIWLLYPRVNTVDPQIEIRFDSKDNTVVRVFFVDLEHIDDSMTALGGLIK